MRFIGAAGVVVCLTGLAAPPQAAAQRGAPPQSSVSARSQAYEAFLLARRFEDEEDVERAVASYRRAMELDPSAPDIPAALADLYAGSDRLDEAAAAAERALAIDAGHRDANRVLGTIYASRAMAEAPRNAAARQAQQQNLDRAIRHLEGAAVRPADGGMVDVNVRAMLARLYVAGARYDQAIPLLSDIVRQEPGWTDGASLLVEAYTAANRTQEAVQWLEQGAPDNPNLYPLLADLYGRAQQWRDAAAAYQLALSYSPRNVDLRVRYAQMLMNAGGEEELAAARDSLREAIAIRNNDERVLYMLSQAERRSGDLDAAEATARRLIAQNANNPRGYAVLVEAMADRFRYRDILDMLLPAVNRFRMSANNEFPLSLLLPHLGYTYQQLGRHADAANTFEEANKIAGGDPVLFAYTAQALIAGRQFDRAAEVARAARANHPDDVRLAQLEAQALRHGGRVDQGIAVLAELVQRVPEDPDAHIALAHAYSESSRGDQAIKLLQDARTRFPEESTGINFELGAVFERQKQYAQAEAAFREVIASEPAHAPALNYLGYMLADRGERLGESVELIQRALAIEPENGSYLDSLGWAYFKNGRFDLAEEYLRRAAARMATNSVVQDHYGDVLFRLGRLDDAIAAWRLALSGDGDSIVPSEIERKIGSARQSPR